MTWWLVTFARRGPARYLSHLDTTRALQRSFARAGIPLGLSHGMRPKPCIALPLPLPVGAAGREELAVVEVTEHAGDLAVALTRLRAAVPPGLEPLAMVSAGERHPRPQPSYAEYTCEVCGDADQLAKAAQRFVGEPHVIRERVSPKGRRTLDLKDYVVAAGARPVPGGAELAFAIRYRSAGAARPQEYVDLIAEWAGVEPVMRGLERLRVAWKDGSAAPGAAAEGVELSDDSEEGAGR